MCFRTSNSGQLLLQQRATPSAGWSCSAVAFRVFLITTASFAVWNKPLCCSPGLGKVQLLLVFSVEPCQWDQSLQVIIVMTVPPGVILSVFCSQTCLVFFKNCCQHE